jgi:hypothetical protein
MYANVREADAAREITGHVTSATTGQEACLSSKRVVLRSTIAGIRD